jgi:D-alanine-D-alanine ligase
MKRLRIAVLMGGTSTEREVSLRSGARVVEALRASGAVVLPVDVTSESVELPAAVDVVFIALHGAFGEDGHVQQLLEDRDIAYTGSDAGASARAFDKVLAKELFVQAGIPTPEAVVWRDDWSALEEMRWPVVVKPSRQGSSVGVSIVRDRAGLPAAVAKARQYGGEVLVERFIRGRELTVGILGRQPLPVVEIRPRAGRWFDYESKYGPNGAEEICPAPLCATLTARAHLFAWRAHECLGCRDFSRVDLMLSECGELFVLEVNTIPGLTETSLLPKAAQAAGWDMTRLCTRMVEMALARRCASTVV